MTETNKIFWGSDHAGYSLKISLFSEIQKVFSSLEMIDLGCVDANSVDYPDYAEKVSKKVLSENARGILICGSGTGMAISANKISGIRAANAWDVTSARLSREHNHTNIICLGSRLVGTEVATDILKIWLKTEFLGGRHQNRIDKLHLLEKGK